MLEERNEETFTPRLYTPRTVHVPNDGKRVEDRLLEKGRLAKLKRE